MTGCARGAGGLQSDADSVKSNDPHAVLYEAVRAGGNSVQRVRGLVSAGTLAFKDADGRTALHMAAGTGQVRLS